MTEDVRSIALRLVDTLGHPADPESFSEDDAWGFMIELREHVERGIKLSPQVVAVLQELAAAIGITPGAPAEVWAPALEYELGSSPYPANEVAVAMRAIHAAVNGEFESGPRHHVPDDKKLTGGVPAEYTPNKNLDFGEPESEEPDADSTPASDKPVSQ
jgi:hypothetical protein